MTLTTYPVAAADSPDLTALSLSRLVHRLELNLLVPSADLSPLRQSEFQRMRVGANIAFAQSTLTSLERALPTIKAPDRRNDLQTDLLLYRQTLKKLQAVLDEITTEAEVLRSARRSAAGQDADDESESESLDDEDLLGVVTPEEGSNLFPLPLPHAQTDPTPSSSTASQTESQLTTDRTTQEDLTTSLLSLASQLKSSSHAFHSSLESEKSVLARAVDGLDRSTGSMGAAERRMGTLRRMTEGKGWWGRMMLYAWIFGLWLLAILIVFLGPKLRF
ncbi:hypothetical protein BDW42DRAFT_196447 [Aspergillus taichungensis]|uniref:Synaptobrevin n=1 Tax=Aspergillus taichungensis TaxID=482145 RepID=A0A2J5HKB2_9EURO|nr:hypothetical protein BDW42DRAFT_196447 [Aspergillus taichungensis]